MKIRSISIVATVALLGTWAGAQRVPGLRQEQRAERMAERQAQKQAHANQMVRPTQPQVTAAPRQTQQPGVNGGNVSGGAHPGQQQGSWLREHQNLTPAQQEQALRSDPGFQKLPPQRQAQLLQQLDNFNSRPPQQREQMLDRMETLERFTPEQRQQVRNVWEQFRDLPQDRKQRVRQTYQKLLCMSPSDRQAMLTSGQFHGNFNDQERGIINGALAFGVPVNGGAQPNCSNGPQSSNMLDEELLSPALSQYWAALQPAAVIPTLAPSSVANSVMQASVVSSVGSGAATVATGDSSGSVRSGQGSAVGPSSNGGTDYAHGSDRNQHPDPNANPSGDLIRQIVAYALDRVQGECSTGAGRFLGNGITFGDSLRPSAPRINTSGSTSDGLATLLARVAAEPDSDALAQQIMRVVTATLQARQDEQVDQACVSQATLEFTAEIEQVLGVRHGMAAGSGETDAAPAQRDPVPVLK